MFPLYDENRIRNKIPFATVLLIVLNTVLFFYTSQNLDYYISAFGFSPHNLWDGQFFTIITAMFLHGSIWHLLGNMWFLWIFGDSLEARMGSVKFLLFYLFCGVGSGIFYALASTDASLVIGASGAISGVLGGYIVMLPGNKIKAYFPPIFFLSVPAIIYIFVWFLLQLFSVGDILANVAYWAHVGGFLTGMVSVKLFRKR
jgi:membrane associated rhomboid family serine protease